MVPSISATAATVALTPGASADPSRVVVSVWRNAEGQQNLLLCNASQAERSYCIRTTIGVRWTYGKGDGSILKAATAILNGYTQVW
jgi:hypothetical protein